MPNRMIKDSIHTSEKVNAMTDFQFRLWISLIAMVDDYGRGDARPAVIKGACFPLRERLTIKDISAALAGLAGIGCIVLYEVDGRPFLCFPNWEKHQTIRNKRSKFPAPPDNLQAIDFNCNQLNANVPVIQSNPIQIESNPNTNTNMRFAPPALEEVEKYCRERGNNVSAQGFIDYYSSNGWKVGKNAMKDWKAAVRTWERNGYDKPKNAPIGDYGDRSVDIERLKKMAAKIG